MCRAEDAEPWKIFQHTTPTARKAHTCVECGRTIQSGEQYHRGRGVLYGGPWESYAWCRHCDAAARWLSRECGGYLFEEVLTELVEHWNEDTAFRSVWLARSIAGMRRKWCDGRTPVPGEPPVLAVPA